MIADGRLPSYRVGDRLIRVQRADVDALVRRAS
ncbi:MAG: excisionase family DNA-binding protein [Luteococcus sp.]|nr:excisionase family DNA-binding protein [Luteococcus sp.]